MCLEYVVRSSGNTNAVSEMFLALCDCCLPLQQPNLQKNETSKKPQTVTGQILLSKT